MMKLSVFFASLAVMAGVTYLVRLLPLLLCRRPIRNRFVRSLLFYLPYAVLGAMTVPAVLYSTGSLPSAAAGLAVAVVLAYFEKKLPVVAGAACAAALLTEGILSLF